MNKKKSYSAHSRPIKYERIDETSEDDNSRYQYKYRERNPPSKMPPGRSHYAKRSDDEPPKDDYGTKLKREVSTPMEFKLCTYTGNSTCNGRASCILIENTQCFAYPTAGSLLVSLVGRRATYLHFPDSSNCVQSQKTIVVVNQDLEKCFPNPFDPNLSWKLTKL